ncbi:MAG: hypothetical protein COA96_15675 [SAR86 cluster bacterium]|uniref:PD-(D/E)XK endonuclease-like domain-containing protein n=1 Tax=SAR86 cluster bacterium TaxID=2030880 RepID=A0A2A5AQ39_9GAMM|nr:MAG: hypothetical protein COA96_15675 [SAR86 cluster bacterium]
MTIKRFDIQALLKPLENNHTIIAPNHRTVDAILLEYAALKNEPPGSGNAWSRPNVLAIDIWLQNLWQTGSSQAIAPFCEADLLNRFNEQFIWIQLLQSSYNKFPLLNTEAAAASVARSYQFFRQWELDNNPECENYKAAQDFQAFLAWSEQYKNYCNEHQLIDLTDATKLLIDNLDKLAAFIPQDICLVNFSQPPPLYAKLFSALSKATSISRVPESHPTEAGKTCSMARYEFKDAAAEIDACISWSLDKVKNNPDAHIGIVMAHGRTLEPLIEDAFFKRQKHDGTDDFVEKQVFNRLSSQETLLDLKLVNSALALLELNNETIDTQRFCQIIRSPRLVAAEDELQSRIALEIALRNNIESKTRLSHLQAFMRLDTKPYYCPVLAKSLLEFTELRRRSKHQQTAEQWIELFQQQLELLGWPGEPLANTERSHLLQWQQTLDQLAASSGTLGNIDIATCTRSLKTLLKSNKLKHRFNSTLQISLLDIEEAQDFSFDELWILGMDSKSWPAATSPAAFIPYSLQSKIDMPGSSNQLQLDLANSQLFTAQHATSGQLIVSHHEQEDELKLRPSALINSVVISSQEHIGASSVAPSPSDSELEIITEALNIPLKEDEAVSGGSGLLSNQSNCPFKAFARNRLKVQKLNEFAEGITPFARGNALHLALEKLGIGLGSLEKINQASASNTDLLIAQSIEPAIDQLRDKFPETMTPAFALLETKRLTSLLHGFLTLEKQRPNFVIQSTEKSLKWTHSNLALNFRIDRVDKLDDESLLLIDYKSGKKVNYKWFDDRPDDLQLPLYQLAISEQTDEAISATIIFQVNAENIGLSGTTDRTDLPTLKPLSQARAYEGDWLQLQTRWNDIIHSLVEEFENGLLAVAPTRGATTCQYCDFKPLCRVSEFDQLRLDHTGEDL